MNPGRSPSRAMAGLMFIASVCLLSVGAASGGKHVFRSVGIHPDLVAANEFKPSTGVTLLMAASDMIQTDDEHCDDVPLCITVASDGAQYQYGGVGDGWLDLVFNSRADLELWLSQVPTPQIKVSRSITVEGRVWNGGTLLPGNPYGAPTNSVIAVYGISADPEGRTDETTWAHEFGHQCGIPHQYTCSSEIMAEPTPSGIWRDTIRPEYAATWDIGAGLLGFPDAAYCSASGDAGLRELKAVLQAQGVAISFTADWEEFHESYTIERIDPVTGAVLYSVGTPAASPGTTGAYELLDAGGDTTAVYRIVEHQTGALPDLVSAPVFVHRLPSPEEVVEGDYEALQEVVNSYRGPSDPPGIDPCSNRFTILHWVPEYEILVPDYWSGNFEPYASLWNARGVRTVIITESLADSCYGGFQGWIANAAATGTTHFLIAGDASAHQWDTDPTKWPPTWPMTTLPATPLHDIIPTLYVPVSDPPTTAWTVWTPYFATDLPYSDIDGDGLPDVVVARLPVSSAKDIDVYTYKLAQWLDRTGGNLLSHGIALYTRAEDHDDVLAIPTAMGSYDLERALEPSGIIPRTLTQIAARPKVLTAADQDAAKAFLRSATRDVSIIIWNVNATDGSTNPPYVAFGDYVAPGMPASDPGGFISVGLSCGLNSFDMYDGTYLDPYSLQPRPDRPMVEGLLFGANFSTGNWLRGAIAQVGPTRASQTAGNPLFGAALLRRLTEPNTTLGRAFLLAQRECMDAYPAYRELFKSYVLLGDGRLGPATVTGVQYDVSLGITRLTAPYPNPSNPGTTLRYYLAEPGEPSLVVFDVHGRRLRSLLEGVHQDRGWSSVHWDGKDSSGRRVGSGVYFVQLSVGGVRYSNRVVILK